MTTQGLVRRYPTVLERVNTTWHELGLALFALVVVMHWVEHVAQGVQVFVLGWARPAAGGALGLAWPALVTSEALHYGYAVVMLAAFWALRHGFTGSARSWWTAALVLQFWHHVEHLVLLAQAVTGSYWFGAGVPMSFLQPFIPRVELHLIYNTVVTIPMLVAMALHRWPRDPAANPTACSCARR